MEWLFLVSQHWQRKIKEEVKKVVDYKAHFLEFSDLDIVLELMCMLNTSLSLLVQKILKILPLFVFFELKTFLVILLYLPWV